MKRKKIPIHIDELNEVGVSVQVLNIDKTKTHLLKAHRDEYYIFLLQEKGNLKVMLDFDAIALNSSSFIFIKPGQVHYYLPEKSLGWVVKVSPAIIEKKLRDYLDKLASQSVAIADNHKLVSIFKLIDDTLQSSNINTFEVKEIQFYVNAFAAMVCNVFSSKESRNLNPQSRLMQIKSTFKQLLKEHFRTLKKPAQYADLLHISTAYLNETLVNTTGFSTSYWIQQELFLEAKRLLHHTELTAKQIAFELGFEDHTYFARLFKKVNGLTPIDFRKAYLDLSN
nr:helix-turn-helix transcriptional regulator [uncultured Flavobacterium sp.]